MASDNAYAYRGNKSALLKRCTVQRDIICNFEFSLDDKNVFTE